MGWSKVKQVKENPLEAKLAFIKKSVDDKCSAAISAVPEDALVELIGDMDVTVCRNLSAMIWSKVKKAGYADAGGTENARENAKGNVKYRLDDRVQEELKNLSADDQEAVLSELNAQAEVKNPSAFVWTRVKALKKSS